MYTIFDFASDLGGLQGALDVVFAILCSFYAPAVYARSILKHNFKFDSSTSPKSKRGRLSNVNEEIKVM